MYCEYCGKKIEDNSKYCLYCGSRVNEFCEEIKENVTKKEDKPAKVWKTFAKVSRILGIVSICTFFVPLIGFVETGPVGVVLGILGGRAKDEEADDWRRTGITLSIIGACLSLVSYILLYVLLLFSVSAL